MNKKKYLKIALIFICIISITLIGTYALKLWSSTDNTELTFRIGEYQTDSMICKASEDITVSNIGPVFDYEKDGEVITFRAIAASSNTTPLNVSFNISTITNNLKETSFKYALMSSTDKTNYTEILKGDFSNINSGSSIDLIKDKVITKTTYYKLIIYIDGNMENPTSMQNGSLTGNVEMCIEGGDGDININSFKVDGVETTKFPLSSGYNIDTTCSDANITFDYKSQSYEISNITKNKAKCGITYTTKTNKTYLNNYIKGLAGTTQGTGQLVNEMASIDNSTFTTNGDKLARSSYSNLSNDATYPFTWSDTDKTWTSTNHTDSKTATLSFNVATSGYYQMCYKQQSEHNYDYTTIKKDNTQIKSLEGIYNSYYECFYLGNLTTSNTITISYSKDSSTSNKPDNVVFYLQIGTYNENIQNVNAGYRYEGKNPNNYIYFNNELWRIIGVFDASSHGKTGEYLTKIIRNDSLGGYVWDKSEKNNWATSSLYNLLNTNYYNATDGTSGGNCYLYRTYITGNCDYTVTGIQSEYRSMVKNVTWYLGGKDNDTYTAEAFYTGERDSTSVYSGNTASTTGYIGLMYASDYGYSVLSSSCDRTTKLGNYNISTCRGASWLTKEGNEWTVTHQSSYNSSYSLSCTAALGGNTTGWGYTTRPVLYLNSTVQKISGSGTITDPYKIGY